MALQKGVLRMKELIIIDTHHIAHTLVNVCKPETEAEIQLECLKEYLYLMGKVYDPAEMWWDRDYLWVGDTKPYWRTLELLSHGVSYKGSKARVRSESQEKVVATTLEELGRLTGGILRHVIDQNPVYPGGRLGAEADDLAAMACDRLHREYDQVTLIANDFDWLGLLRFPNVRYLDKWTTMYISLDTWEEWKEKRSRRMKARRVKPDMLCSLDSPADIWVHKVEHGDVSDNIPAGMPNQFIMFYDLLNPPSRYRCDSVDYKAAIVKGITIDVAEWEESFSLGSSIVKTLTPQG